MFAKHKIKYLAFALLILVLLSAGLVYAQLNSTEQTMLCFINGDTVLPDGKVIQGEDATVCFNSRVDALIYITDGEITSLPEDTEEAYTQTLINYYAQINAEYEAQQGQQ